MEIKKLTDEQRKSVSHFGGAACVIAGAGTGKTTSLIGRIGFLVQEQKISPRDIIVTTFTRKATAELYAKTVEILGEEAQQLKIFTIDALIMNYASEAMREGLMPSRRLIDKASQKVLLFECAWEVFGEKQPMGRSRWVDGADDKNLIRILEQMLQAEIAEDAEKIHERIRQSLSELQKSHDAGYSFPPPSFQDLETTITRYREKLEELSATDLDFLARDFLRVLKKNKKFVKELAFRSRTIVVDEFQDTSRVHAEILLILAPEDRNIWVVGDPCQQIYEWRGADPHNMYWFIEQAAARKYNLKDNRRCTQPILDAAYSFLKNQIPSLEKSGMLNQLNAQRDRERSVNRYPVFLGKLEDALQFVMQLLDSNPGLKPHHVAILSDKLTTDVSREIKNKAEKCGLKVWFHSSRADHARDETIGKLPRRLWKPSNALNELYQCDEIQGLISTSLQENDFAELRKIQPLALAADALDSTLKPDSFTFDEAWPALKKSQDREIAVSSAVVNDPDCIQVMTIHASKGLEFPVVLLMKFSKKFPGDEEDNRLVYVGATRARDLLLLIHSSEKPQILDSFGRSVRPLKNPTPDFQLIEISEDASIPPLIAATHLDLYKQCPLLFAAYHEGRFIPKWTPAQSKGSRLHKTLEYYLRGDLPSKQSTVDACFERGFREGDSPMRKLSSKDKKEMKEAYKKVAEVLPSITRRVIAVEHRYRYVHKRLGQIDGVVDAIIEEKDGRVALVEWKTAKNIQSKKERSYKLQAAAGALGITQSNPEIKVQVVRVIPLFDFSQSIELPFNSRLKERTIKELDQIFQSLQNRNYEPHKGKHCESCQLQPQCPAWTKEKRLPEPCS